MTEANAFFCWSVPRSRHLETTVAEDAQSIVKPTVTEQSGLLKLPNLQQQGISHMHGSLVQNYSLNSPVSDEMESKW